MIIDANILIYAVDTESQHHEVAHRWLTNAMNGPERLGLPWVSLIAFQRITTHSRIYRSPLDPTQASDIIQAWLEHPNTWVPSAGERHAGILRSLTVRSGATGNLVTDAHLAALAIEHGASLASFDEDYRNFPDLRWIHPARQ